MKNNILKKAIKSIIIFFIFFLPFFIFFLTSIYLKSNTLIYFGGSSGVKSFVDSFALSYEKNNKVDIVTDIGGSGFGIRQIACSQVDVGMSSKNPYTIVKQQYKSEWIKNDCKTVTIGWESICIVYIPPKGLSSYANEVLNSYLELNSNNICKLYATFSGYKGNILDSTPNLGLFLKPNIEISETDRILFNKTSILPYARSGGSNTSGTAASFITGSHLKVNIDSFTESQMKAFEFGAYGNDFKIIDTDEANSRAWEIFSVNNRPGSMIYLSSGFVQKNLDLLRKKKYGILSYNGIPFNIDDVKKGYNFYRPLNLVLNLTKVKQDVKDFIEFIATPNKDSELWHELGATCIDETDYHSMCDEKNNFWSSDVSLNGLDISSSWPDKIVFGAKDE